MTISVSRSRTSAMSPALFAWTALGSALIGLPYVLRLFGNVEVEVTHWGWVSIGLGGALLASERLTRVLPGRATAVAVAMTVAMAGAVALLQSLPALLWVLFHGNAITDGSPPGGFIGHWAFAVPHVVVAALAVAALYRLLRARPAIASPGFEEELEAHCANDGASDGAD